MVTKEELEKSTFIGRNANVWFMTAWALMMFIIDGVVYAVDPPPGESKWGYGPTVFLLCLVRGARRTNDASRANRNATAATRERGDERRFARCDDESDGRGESKRERERDRAREIERGLRRDDARGDGRRRGANRANRANHSRRLTVNDASKRAQIASFLWGAVSIRKTERAHRGELTRLRETKTLAELMSLNMGA